MTEEQKKELEEITDGLLLIRNQLIDFKNSLKKDDVSEEDSDILEEACLDLDYTHARLTELTY